MDYVDRMSRGQNTIEIRSEAGSAEHSVNDSSIEGRITLTCFFSALSIAWQCCIARGLRLSAVIRHRKALLVPTRSASALFSCSAMSHPVAFVPRATDASSCSGAGGGGIACIGLLLGYPHETAAAAMRRRRGEFVGSVRGRWLRR